MLTHQTPTKQKIKTRKIKLQEQTLGAENYLRIKTLNIVTIKINTQVNKFIVWLHFKLFGEPFKSSKLKHLQKKGIKKNRKKIKLLSIKRYRIRLIKLMKCINLIVLATPKTTGKLLTPFFSSIFKSGTSRITPPIKTCNEQ